VGIIGGMKRLLVIATVVAATVSLGVLAALVARPSPAGSVPAIELVAPPTASSPPATTDSNQEDAPAGRPNKKDESATSPRSGVGEGASPVPAPSPAPAGDDGDGDDGSDDDDDDGGDD
jgi:hypothetical protein